MDGGAMETPHETSQAWSGTYRNHLIAVQRSDRDWLVTLGQDRIGGMSFETTDEAIAWLRRKVDVKIAEEIFPGLSSANFGLAT